MSELRLLLVTDAVGGVWTYSVELARALEPFGVETLLATIGPAANAAQREQAQGLDLVTTDLPLDWLDTSPSELRRAADALAAIAARESAHVVQTSSAALLADAAFEQPCVAVQHSCVATWWAAVKGTPLPEDFAWRRELVRCGLQRASAIVAPSEAFATDTARTYDLDRPIMAIHNGRRTAAGPMLPQGDFVFTAGRLWDEGKNVATLDRAAARIGVPVQAAGAVYGPNGAGIGLRHVRSLGEVSAMRIAGLLAARPIFASASLYEPFGLSVLEAAQAGCAMVLSDIPTHRELWDGAALFVEPRDDAGFASALQALIDDSAQRSRLGERAQASARRYSPEHMARSMSDIYAAVLKQPAPLEMAGAA